MKMVATNDPEQLLKVRQHMDSIGYKTKEDQNGFSACLNDVSAFLSVINVRPLNGGFHLYIKRYLKCNDGVDAKFVDLVNGMNGLSSLWRTFVSAQGDLVQDFWYSGPYSKKHYQRVLVVAELEGQLLADNFGELYRIYCV